MASENVASLSVHVTCRHDNNVYLFLLISMYRVVKQSQQVACSHDVLHSSSKH